MTRGIVDLCFQSFDRSKRIVLHLPHQRFDPRMKTQIQKRDGCDVSIEVNEEILKIAQFPQFDLSTRILWMRILWMCRDKWVLHQK